MKLTTKQQWIVNQIKEHGRLWCAANDRALFKSFETLANRGLLTMTIDGSGCWFDLV